MHTEVTCQNNVLYISSFHWCSMYYLLLYITTLYSMHGYMLMCPVVAVCDTIHTVYFPGKLTLPLQYDLPFG